MIFFFEGRFPGVFWGGISEDVSGQRKSPQIMSQNVRQHRMTVEPAAPIRCVIWRSLTNLHTNSHEIGKDGGRAGEKTQNQRKTPSPSSATSSVQTNQNTKINRQTAKPKWPPFTFLRSRANASLISSSFTGFFFCGKKAHFAHSHIHLVIPSIHANTFTPFTRKVATKS